MKIYLVTTENCGACRKLKNAMDYASMLDNIEIKTINPVIKADMDFIKQYQIVTFPTLLKINRDNIEKLIGLQPLDRIRKFIEEKR